MLDAVDGPAPGGGPATAAGVAPRRSALIHLQVSKRQLREAAVETCAGGTKLGQKACFKIDVRPALSSTALRRSPPRRFPSEGSLGRQHDARLRSDGGLPLRRRRAGRDDCFTWEPGDGAPRIGTIRQSCPACRGAGAWSDCGPLGGRRRYSEEVGSTAIASIETRRPRGSRTCAGADRAGGGSGMWRAYTSLRRPKSSTSA